MKKIILFIVILILLVPLYLGSMIIFAVITDYQPTDIEPSIIYSESKEAPIDNLTLTIMTYNIGYGGLDATQDFFMEGGNNTRPSSMDQVANNTQSFIQTINDIDPDFIAMQEVDIKARRSYKINQANTFKQAFQDDYALQFAHNFNVKWIPKPWLDPTGNVESGLLTFSKYMPISSMRYPLPSDFPFPEKYFMLDRCFMENIYEVANGKKLYFINLHLSAYDDNSNLKLEQINVLKDYAQQIINEDHYLILAGDYNMVFDEDYFNQMKTPLPGWVSMMPQSFLDLPLMAVADYNVTTTRSNEQPYVNGENFETVIDGFFVSDNITVKEIKGMDLGYKNTDHNPVVMKIILNDTNKK